MSQKNLMARQANKTRKDHAFKAGDSVLLSANNLSMEEIAGTRKLRPRFCGSLTILRMVSYVTAKLDLSAQMRAKGIHDAFHLSLLKPDAKDTLEIYPETLPPIHVEDGNEEYEVEKSSAIEKDTEHFSI